MDRQRLSLGQYETRVKERLQSWQRESFASRLWKKDPTLWFSKKMPEITNRLGWLTLPAIMQEQVGELVTLAQEANAEGIRHVVLLGMGGSSLAPEVFQDTFDNRPGYPELIVLDSTHPGAVHATEQRVDARHTLFLVSSKSGTTLETLSLFRYFWRKVSEVSDEPGSYFIAITDPGTPLEKLARERAFRLIFKAPPDVGGRYSALTVFGLVPASLIGVDVQTILDLTRVTAEAIGAGGRESEDPCLALGAALGELALSGRDKVTFVAAPSVSALPGWIEQLIAESTGKDKKGVIPVAHEPVGPAKVYGRDRFFIRLSLDGDHNARVDHAIAALEHAGHPVGDIRLHEKVDLGQEFFRWEVAAAAAGAVLRIHPFNQPDVELAKDLARKAMTQKKGREGKEQVLNVPALPKDDLRRAVEGFFSHARPGDYVAIQAYLAPETETTAAIQEMRLALRNRLHLATTLGYGPRFLHSTGQLHKGGPNTGLFLQIVDEPADDLPVPETDYTFGKLIHAQALGDYQALLQRGRRVLRLNLGKDVRTGLAKLREALE